MPNQKKFIDKNSFDKIFESGFWKKMNKSLVPFSEIKVDKLSFLEKLYLNIIEYTYNPQPPRDYIVFNKYNGISRYVPTFSREDYCVYFLCVKLLEDNIAENRVKGTFGGWTLGNALRKKEHEEALEVEYVPYNSLDPFAWRKNWDSFQDIAKSYRDTGEFNCFVNLDIANFYDSINLFALERKIRQATDKEYQEIITLLFHFLQKWNRKLEGYNLKTVGIPQDEIGDCSRILANFYLQDYDLSMQEICSKFSAKYIRYADDQIIYANNKETAKLILFEASKELLKINLNFNAGKAKFFDSKDNFDEYWAFRIFDLLKLKDQLSINKALKIYFSNIEQKIDFKKNSVLKKILSLDFRLVDVPYKHKLIAMFYEQDFLSNCKLWELQKIKSIVNNDDEFYAELDNLVSKVQYNSFHYNLVLFYKKVRKKHDLSVIEQRIVELKDNTHF